MDWKKGSKSARAGLREAFAAVGMESGKKGLKSFIGLHRGDLIAGLSVAGLLIPEAVAYAGIAGMPPASGIIALVCGLLCYCLIGTSRFAVVSATSSSAMILGAAVASLSAATPNAQPETIAAVLVMMGGFWFLAGRLLGLGRATNFIARPVLRGVTIGLSFTIILMQLPKLFGIHASAPSAWERLAETVSSLGAVRPAAAATGLVALGLLFALRRFFPRHPASLYVVALSVAAAFLLPLTDMGVELVGEINLYRETASLDNLASFDWMTGVQLSAALCVMVYAESYSSIHSAAARHGDPTNSNRDIVALGVANTVSGFFGGLSVGAGFSATSLNEQSGAVTRFASIATLVLVIAGTLFLLPLIQKIPEPVLAAIVIDAVRHGLSVKPVLPYFKWRKDRFLVVASFVSVAFLGVVNGLVISIVLSMLFLMLGTANADASELRQLSGSHSYVSTRYFNNTIIHPEILVLRFGQPLFFGNAEPMISNAAKLLHNSRIYRRVSYLVISLEESPDLDGTSMESLIGFARSLREQGCELSLCRLHGKAYDSLLRIKADVLTADCLTPLSVDRAVKKAIARRDAAKKHNSTEPS